MKDKRRRQLLGAAYGMGLVKQAQIAGEYPPPPVDVPKITRSLRAAELSGRSGAVTGRLTSRKPNFVEQYGGKPRKLG